MKVIANHPPTEEVQALDAAHHLHPFTDGKDLARIGARVISRAKGVILTDSEGNDLLDAMAGLWCVNIGYGRHELAEAAKVQMCQLPYYNTFFRTTHVPAASLAARLADLTPDDLDHVFFASSGSEANDTNIRLVRHYWAARGKPDKKVIIGRENSYHGSSVGSASLGGMAQMHAQGGLPIPEITHIGEPNWYEHGEDLEPDEFGVRCAYELERKIAELGENRVAAFIAEPVQGAGGVIIPPKTYWPEIQRICDRHEVLLIADEVICGFGRTGEWFGCQAMGIRPQIMTIAKGVTSGYLPLGGSIVSAEVADVLKEAGEFFHGYTYSGHPVACAVALENLRIMEEEGLIGYVRDVAAPYLAEKWAGLSEHPMVGEARSLGLLASLALTPDKATRAAFDAPKGTVGLRCRDASFDGGLVMRHVGDRMVISPPLIITPDEIDTLVERAWVAIDKACNWAKAEGLVK